MSVVFSHDNKYIVSGSEDRSIKVFDLQTRRELHHLKDVHSGINEKYNYFDLKT